MRTDTERADPSWDELPETLTLRPSRVLPAIAFVLGTAMVTVMIVFWHELLGDSLMAWLVVGLPVLGTVGFALHLHPDTCALVIDRGGVSVLWPLFKATHHPWSEIVDFRVVNIEGDDCVGFDLVGKQAERRRKPLLFRILRFRKADQYLPSNYRIPPRELAATLNRFRKHYARSDAEPSA